MESNLRPLTFSEILDRIAQLYRENFLLFAGISAVYAGVLLIMSLLPRLGRYLWLMTIAAFVVWTPFTLIYSGYFAAIFLFARPKGVLAQTCAGAATHHGADVRPTGSILARSRETSIALPQTACSQICTEKPCLVYAHHCFACLRFVSLKH